MATGYLALVLHAHLPYVRHPEHPSFLEEQWLFEAMAETYLPILRNLERLEDDGVSYALTISLSPPLVTMLEDELLQARFRHYIDARIQLADREIERTVGDPALHPLARYYADFFRDIRFWFVEKYQGRIAKGFQRIAALGNLELMTCAATHGFLPFLRENETAVRAQVMTAMAYHEEIFGVRPAGMWVPECAFYPGLDKILAAAGVRYFFVDSKAFDFAEPAPKFGVYAPIMTAHEVTVFARDAETSHQVWAAEVGYPGHANYREFYRDIGFDHPEELVQEFIVAGHVRTNTGIKYHRITKDGERKDYYEPELARRTAEEHARNFKYNRELQINHLAGGMDRSPLIVSPYDAELFGHWWFEGPQFLDFALRKIADDSATVQTITPMQYLEMQPINQVTSPAGSSWGEEGTYEYWLNETNDAILPDLHRAADRMQRAAEAAGLSRPDNAAATAPACGGEVYRVLQQMARELLLAQASDWPFIMRTGTSPGYATKRVENHLARFYTLAEMLPPNVVDEEVLSATEYIDRIFPHINPGWYCR